MHLQGLQELQQLLQQAADDAVLALHSLPQQHVAGSDAHDWKPMTARGQKLQHGSAMQPKCGQQGHQLQADAAAAAR